MLWAALVMCWWLTMAAGSLESGKTKAGQQNVRQKPGQEGRCWCWGFSLKSALHLAHPSLNTVEASVWPDSYAWSAQDHWAIVINCRLRSQTRRERCRKLNPHTTEGAAGHPHTGHTGTVNTHTNTQLPLFRISILMGIMQLSWIHSTCFYCSPRIEPHRPVGAVPLWRFHRGVDGIFGGCSALSVQPGRRGGAQWEPVAVLAHWAQQHLGQLPGCRLAR